jgi:BTB/POZ domain
MLFSEKFSDIRFVCGDGVIVHAHRIVLAESSPYFDAAFSQPWKENENGEWKTSHASHVIKVVLTLLYTGKIDSKLVQEDPLAFISVASEYNLASLKIVAERCCIQLVNANNIKATLQAAHLYDSAILKNACVDFVKKNALAVLAHSRISSLETEDPDLWKEFTKLIVP